MPLAPADAGTEIALPEGVAHHAVRVLRLGTGDAVTLFTGAGGEYEATLIRADRGGAVVRIERHHAIERESPLAVTVVQAVLATDAMDAALRRMVELGAAAIRPVSTARTNAAVPAERAEKRLAHWRQIAIAACEQCGRNRVPEIAPVEALDAWLEGGAPAGERGVAILVPGAVQSLAALARIRPPQQIVVGPEGGFADGEVERAVRHGAQPVHLGARVLRAESAGMAALAVLGAIAGDAR